MVSVGAVRTAALVVCVAGIAGMIVTSILNHNGAAVTFGLVTAVAVLCSMVAKAVTADAERRLAGAGGVSEPSQAAPVHCLPVNAPAAEILADLVERQVEAMVAAGADETALRQLVGEAVRLGRTLAPALPMEGGGH